MFAGLARLTGFVGAHAALGLLAVVALGLPIGTAGPDAAAARPTAAPRQGFEPGSGTLRLFTFTDTLPGTAATAFHALAGEQVRRVYLVDNDGLLPLTDVSVHDPDVSPSAFRCLQDDGDSAGAQRSGLALRSAGADLGPLGWTACSVLFTARVGEHLSTVTATATSPVAGRVLAAQDDAGYTAVAAGLSVHVTFQGGVNAGGSLPAGAEVGASVELVNAGSVRLVDLHPASPSPLSGLACSADGQSGGGQSGGAHVADATVLNPTVSNPTVSALDPGGSATCTGSLRTEPGRNAANLSIAGMWLWDRAITSQGPQSPRSFPLLVVADASYTGIAPPGAPPSPAPVQPPAQPKPNAARTPPRVPTSPKPHPPRSAAPAPSHAPPQAAARFVASRGLSFPLKVLAIVVIPGVAAARRLASHR